MLDHIKCDWLEGILLSAQTPCTLSKFLEANRKHKSVGNPTSLRFHQQRDFSLILTPYYRGVTWAEWAILVVIEIDICC